MTAFVSGWILKSEVLTCFLQHPWAASIQIKGGMAGIFLNFTNKFRNYIAVGI